MAREQVKELATRGVRPASIQAGTTPVVVQQAAEPKIMGLARALGGVNKALGNYTSLVEHASAAEESRILSLTSEERASELEKMEENFDKMERKGQIPFLSNPVSWKRKYRAMGVGLANDLYNEMVSDTGRLNSPEEGDGELALDDILGQEIEKFFEDNPQLSNQPTMTEEFYRAWEAKARAIQSQYGSRQATLTKNTIIRERTNEIYQLYKDVVADSPGDRTLAMNAMKDAWKEMGFLNATQQIEVIANIAKSLADSDPEIVQEFLEDAEGLKVGGATFGKNTKAVDDVAEKISDIMEANEEENRRKVNRDRAEKNAADDDLFSKAKYEFHAYAGKLRRDGTVDFDGNSYTSVQALREAYLEKSERDYAASNLGLYGRIEQYVGEEWSPISRDDTALSWILNRSNQSLVDANTNASFASNLSNVVEEIKNIDPDLETVAESEIHKVQSAARVELRKIAERTANQVSELGLPVKEQLEEFNERYQQSAKEVIERTNKDIEAIKTRMLRRTTDTEKAIEQLQQAQDAGKVVSTRNPQGVLPSITFEVDRLEHNLALFTDAYPKADRKKAAEEIKRGEDMDRYIRIANGTETKGKEFTEYTATGIRVVIAGEYSDEERATALRYVITRQALGGVFTDIKVLRNQRVPKVGVPFNPKTALNPALYFILTEEEIQKGKDDPVVIEKASILGYQPSELVEIQKETYKKYADLKLLF